MPSDAARAVRAALSVAAIYVAFLLCAQFGFLAQLAERLGDRPNLLHGVLGAMAVAGIAAGFAATKARRGALPLALVATAIACAASTLAGDVASSLAAAVALGGALGFATVTLAGRLPRFAPRGRWGAVAGWGTGAAYAVSNLPPLFAGAPEVRAWLPAALCLVAAAWAPDETDDPQSAEAEAPRIRSAFPALLLGFLALVFVDSAVFAHVQATPALRDATWGTPALQLRQGGIHLLAAISAGWLLDRGRLRALLVATAATFALALPALADATTRSAAGALYAVGISIYSAALVAAPAFSGARRSAPWRAAWLYGMAGWIGSGLGVGAAEEGRLVAAAWIGTVAFAVSVVWSELAVARRAARWAIPSIAVAAAGLPLFGLAPAVPRAESAAARGRAVYLAEGCQHCHSQYVRDVAHDTLWWGPRRPLDRRERPPTPGNRRLGPDLANAGLRRSAFWHEAHLRAPQRVSPGSRMPSFEHLFADGSGRGDDLVAYLGALGAGHEAEREVTIAAWRPPAGVAGDATRGRTLFARHCAPCHGAAGRGDGEVTRTIGRPALDLTKGAFHRVMPTPGDTLDDALARTIRFGLSPGTMAGHEWMSDQEVADLVVWVRALADGAPIDG